MSIDALDVDDSRRRNSLSKSFMAKLTLDISNRLHYKDKPNETTLSRRIARHLSQYNWYFRDYYNELYDPSNKVEYPNLDAGWEHFEHIALPRCFKVGENGSGKYDRAEPGENEHRTMLYPVWKTKLVDMGDFGIGVGLYFSTLQLFAIISFIAGIINIPSIAHFKSSEYSLDGKNQGSAVCTETEWEPCPTCTASDWDRHPTKTLNRYAQSSDDPPLTFIKVNDCEISDANGLATFVSLIFVIVAVNFVSWFQDRKVAEFDAAQQTCTDYSIKIMNPPPNAKYPEAWKTFFESRFGVDVKLCTIAIDNRKVIEAVLKRRKLLVGLKSLLPIGMKLNADDYDGMVKACLAVPWWKRLLFFAKLPEDIVKKIHKQEEEIVALANDPKYNVVSVFLTFNSEQDQRSVLEAMSVPKFKEKYIKEEHKFEGKVLKVLEPEEPLSIRWLDLQDTPTKQRLRNVYTFIISILIIFGGARLTELASEVDTNLTSFVIVTQSLATPQIVKWLTSVESHYNESAMIASQYNKITVFRWIATVIVPLVLTPFGNILDGDKGSIFKQISSLLVVELTLRPLLQLIDVPGFIERHILGPRQKDQRTMNLMFDGHRYSIGERYTDFTKIFFLTVFYSTLYPTAFFMAGSIFVVYYWADKFSILRSWRQSAAVGSGVYYSTAFYLQVCTLLYALSAAYFFSEFPFDNACPNDLADISAYKENVNVTLLDDSTTTIPYSSAYRPYKFCDKETIAKGKFPLLPEYQKHKWMGDSQKKWLSKLAWISVAVTVLITVALLRYFFLFFFKPLFFKYHKPDGESSDEKFEEVKEIDSYVPMITMKESSFPLLLCDINDIDEEYIGWSDPNGGYIRHNLVHDVKRVLQRLDPKLEECNVTDLMFSTVKDWSNRPRGNFATQDSVPSGGNSDGPPDAMDSSTDSSMFEVTLDKK